MKITVSKPTAFQFGEKKTAVLPHQRLSIADSLGKRLIRQNPGLVRKVK